MCLVGYLDTLIRRPGIDIEVGTLADGSPMCVAAAAGYVDIVQLLINAGASMKVQTERGDKPLLLAVERDHVGVAKVLMDASDDPCHKVTRLRQDSYLSSECNLDRNPR